jgi:ketosteroid isomerase-like protein
MFRLPAIGHGRPGDRSKEKDVAAQDIDAETGTAGAVQTYVDAFNKSDADAMAACFAASGFILDGMAPHVWSGPSATRQWLRDALAESAHLGVSDFHMTLGAPLHRNVIGDAAYFVAPASLAFKVRGQPVTQAGASFTVALTRVDGRWLIAAWAWTKGGGGGVDEAREPAGTAV